MTTVETVDVGAAFLGWWLFIIYNSTAGKEKEAKKN